MDEIEAHIGIYEEFKTEYKDVLDGVPFIGIGKHEGSYCIKVKVKKDFPHELPNEYKGLRVLREIFDDVHGAF